MVELYKHPPEKEPCAPPFGGVLRSKYQQTDVHHMWLLTESCHTFIERKMCTWLQTHIPALQHRHRNLSRLAIYLLQKKTFLVVVCEICICVICLYICEICVGVICLYVCEIREVCVCVICLYVSEICVFVICLSVCEICVYVCKYGKYMKYVCKWNICMSNKFVCMWKMCMCYMFVCMWKMFMCYMFVHMSNMYMCNMFVCM